MQCACVWRHWLQAYSALDTTAPQETDIEPVLALARSDIRALTPYSHAQWEPRLERLHANESPWRALADHSATGLNRYPEPQPQALLTALARLYDVSPDRVLVGRGSDEAIDLLVRAFCAAGRDAVLITPPTFGMYAVAARIQGAAVIEAALDIERDFAVDVAAVANRLTANTKLVFLCSPNNPTGTLLAESDILSLLQATAERAVVVLDEAYIEFAGVPSAARLIERYPHLVVLRTLSKAHGLAGARIGTLIARPGIVALLRRIIPPYAIAQPTLEAALAVLSAPQLAVSAQQVRTLVLERERIAISLTSFPGVEKVWPSCANFLLVTFKKPQRQFDALKEAGLLVRDFRQQPGLSRALRITVGSPEQNERLLRAVELLT